MVGRFLWIKVAISQQEGGSSAQIISVVKKTVLQRPLQTPLPETLEPESRTVRRLCNEMCETWKGDREMKKLFISQPMRGKSDEEILVVREQAIKAAQELVGEPVEVIDSFFQNAPADARPLWFLGKSLELLSTADVAYFAEGWQEARGCRIEHECAVEYGIDRIEP